MQKELYRLHAAGAPSLWYGGYPVHVPRMQMALLLLAYGHGERGISRSEAVELLWESGTERTLRRRLSQLLHELRQRFPTDLVLVVGERLVPRADALILLGDRGPAFAHQFAAPTKRFEQWCGAPESPRLPAAGESGGSPMPPLIGRDTELSELTAQLTAPSDRTCHLLIVEGPAGIGKSRLVHEVLTKSRMQACIASLSELDASVALSGILQVVLAHPDASSVIESLDSPWAPLIGGIGTPSPTSSMEAASVHQQVLDTILLVLEELTKRSHFLVFIDDAQWLDRSSAAAILHLRRHWCGPSLPLILARRTGSYPDGCESLISATQPDSTWRLAPLTPSASASLVSAAASPPPPESVTRQILRLAQGNPFFLVEMLNQWHTDKESTLSYLTYSLPLPFSVRDLFRAKLLRLTAVERRVIRLLAVANRPLPCEALQLLAQVSESKLITAYESLARLELLNGGASHAELNHGLIRQAVLARIPPLAKRALHAQVARYLTGCGASNEELAVHWHEAGERAAAFSAAREASDAAISKGADEDAIRFLRVASANAPSDAAAAEAALEAGGLKSLRCDFGGAEVDYTEALAYYEKHDTRRALECEAAIFRCRSQLGSLTRSEVEQLVEPLFERAAASECWHLGTKVLAAAADYWDRIGVGEQVQRLWPLADRAVRHGDARAQCEGHCIGYWKLHYGSIDAALDHARSALSIADTHGMIDQRLGALSRCLLGYMWRGTLHFGSGWQMAERAMREAAVSRDVWFGYQVLANIGVHFLDIGELDRADHYLRMAPPAAAETMPRNRSLDVSNRAEVALRRRRFEDALNLFRRGIREDLEATYAMSTAVCHAGAGLSTLGIGALDETTYHEHAVERLVKSGTVSLHMAFPLIAEFRATLAARRGQLGRAMDLLTTAMRRCEGRRVPAWIQLALVRGSLLCRFGRGIAQFEDELNGALKLATSLKLTVRARQLQTILANN